METTPIFYQLFESQSSTYTYLLADAKTREAFIIDPVLETVERDAKWIKELDLKLRLILDTHIHADHITGAAELKKKLGAKTGVAAVANVPSADLALEDNQVLSLGALRLKVLATPGHTDSCLSFLAGDRLFTGDALLIRANGRTDFQQGSAERLYRSITQRLYPLPDSTLVYPAHDYKGQTYSTIGLEKKFNARIPATQSQESFTRIMNELKLDPPKKINEAVPANLAGGEVHRSAAA